MTGVIDDIAGSALQPFHVFRSRGAFDAWHEKNQVPARACEQWIEAQEFVHGFCPCCDEVAPLRVSVGVMFGPHPNLREGLMCPRGLNNRGRLLLTWSNAWIAHRDYAGGAVALFESRTPLARTLIGTAGLDVACSDFVADDAASGTVVKSPRGYEVRHEDLTRSSYADGQFDAVLHNDVLEHIFDVDAALRDCFRILAPGGMLAFTTPIFVEQDGSELLARWSADRGVEQLVEPPEYHGDEARGAILTFHRFGWDLLPRLRGIGFSDAALAVGFNFFAGLSSCNNPYSRNSNVPPCAIVAVKP